MTILVIDCRFDPRVAPIYWKWGSDQAVFGFGHGDRVDVVGHQAPCPHFDIVGFEWLADEIEIGLAVLVTTEHAHRSHAALSHMVRLGGNDAACNPRPTD